MKHFKLVHVALLTLLIVASGCSHGSSPAVPGPMETAGIDASVGYNPHNLIGIYTFICDPVGGNVEIIPFRDAELHLNALKFLEPPPNHHLSLESPPKFAGNILDVDIGIRNPFLGEDQYSGFDVCGIIFTHGSVTGFNDLEIIMAGEGDTRLLNADGYTRWWNPAEFPHGDNIFSYVDGLLGTPATGADYNCTINGYKYFADGLDKDAPISAIDPATRGMSRAGHQNVRHYKIDLSGGLIFNYAIDACWKFPEGSPPYDVPDDFPPGANRPEGYRISVTELKNTLFYDESLDCAGGKLRLQIDVWDHFNAGLNEVHGEALVGLPLASSLTPNGGGEGYSTYQLDLYGDDLTRNGFADLLIEVRTEEIDYGGILPGKPVSSYFINTFEIGIDGPNGWARTWGGMGSERGHGVATVGSDYVYAVGRHNWYVDFDPGPGKDMHFCSGSGGYLTKFDKCGRHQWAYTYGSPDTENPNHCGTYGVDADDIGNIYITGKYGNTVDFDPGPGTDEHTTNGGVDVFLVKFNPDDDFLWARTWGCDLDNYNSPDKGEGVTVDALGNVYVIGQFYETVDFDPGPGVEERTAITYREIFLSKFSPIGDFEWVMTWDVDISGYNPMMVTDNYGNLYFTGGFYDTVDFDPGPGVDNHTSQGISGSDIFVCKVGWDGNYHGTITWGGNKHDSGNGITSDDYGNIYVVGSFFKTVDFDPGPEVDERTAVGQWDAFLSVFNSNGDYQWALTWGGPDEFGGGDSSRGVVIDYSGNIYVFGTFNNMVDFDPGPGTDYRDAGAGGDIFLSKFDMNGTHQWVRNWGNKKGIGPYGIAVDDSGNVYFTGSFVGMVDFDPGIETEYHYDHGAGDAFIVKSPPDGDW